MKVAVEKTHDQSSAIRDFLSKNGIKKPIVKRNNKPINVAPTAIVDQVRQQFRQPSSDNMI